MLEKIKPQPSMDEKGLSEFKKQLAISSCYLEYGCGGSTVYACEVAKVKTVISVESDKAWALKVNASLDGTASKILLEHCDVGTVGDWGRPINNEKINDFWRYMVMPWTIAKKEGFIPDTVLIDGRFRVASFLYSLLSARIGTVILFDDYLERPEYFVVEEFCKLNGKSGRMGVFNVTHNYSILDLAAKIAKYSIQPA